MAALGGSAPFRNIAAWPIDADPALTRKGWASPETTMTTENLAPSRELNRADPRFDIKALCLQAVDGHGERSSGRLFRYQGQKGSTQHEEYGRDLVAGRCQREAFHPIVRPGLGDAGTVLRRVPLLRGAYCYAGAAGISGNKGCRRDSNGGGGRGRGGGTGDRHPRRIRRAAGPVAGSRRRRAAAAAGQW